MRRSLSLAIAAGLCCSFAGAASAQEFSSGPIADPILDAATLQSTPIVISGGPLIADLDVRINITHTWDSDLDIALVLPNGLEYVHLTSDNQGAGDNYINTVFDQSAAASITTAVAPATGSWQPEGGVLAWIGTIPLPPVALANLDAVNGVSANGSWTLLIDDDTNTDVGTLTEWALIITAAGGPTNPRAAAIISPNNGTVGTVINAQVTVTPGQNPDSTGITVTADAANVDAGSVTLLDNGVAPDLIAGDNIFTADITVGGLAAFGPQNMTFNVSDGQGRSASSTATFTVRPAAAGNDSCSTPEIIPNTSLPYTTPASPINGNIATLDATMCVGAAYDVWYEFTAPTSTTYRFTTDIGIATGNSVNDTVLAIYDAQCGGTQLYCDDDSGAGLQSLINAAMIGGQTYYIQVAKYGTAAPGAADTLGLYVENPTFPPTATINVTPNSGYEGSSFNVFMTVTPGSNPVSTGIVASIDCTGVGAGLLTLQDDGIAPDVAAGDNIYSGTGTVAVGTAIGAQPLYWSVTDNEFRSSNGQVNFTVIQIPEGACCLGGGLCQILREADCNAAGGSYQGNNTPCDLPGGYRITDGSAAFEDISTTGADLFLVDDSNGYSPLGFSFNYFGNIYSDIFVGSNGLMTFGVGSNAYINTAIPAAAAPNDAIYVMWDDFNPGAGGQVLVETRGTAGTDLRFIAQWNNVPQYGQTDANTFQAVLFENGTIEFRYLAISAFTDVDATVGTENIDGTAAISTPASLIGSGTTKVLAYTGGGPICGGGNQCLWQNDGCFPDYDNNGGIDGDDIVVFFADWDAGLTCSDIDGSGGVDSDDVILYFSAWDASGVGTPGC